jgi:hypothetical protein
MKNDFQKLKDIFDELNIQYEHYFNTDIWIDKFGTPIRFDKLEVSGTLFQFRNGHFDKAEESVGWL